MFSTIWHTVFFDPIYNGLIYFIDIIPGGDVGIAIVLIVTAIKILLFPISVKAAKTQKIMKTLEPKLKELKKTITDPQEQAKASMALYKDAGMNPFVGLIALIQLPIFIALYLAVINGGGIKLPEINVALLYSFVPQPEAVSMMFLGLIDITQKSLPLALLAGVGQFIYGYFVFTKPEKKEPGAEPSMKEDFMRSLYVQMKFVMPVMMAIFAYTLGAMVGLYFVISSITSIVQELFVRKHKV